MSRRVEARLRCPGVTVLALLLGVWAVAAEAQTLDRPPNLGGVWTAGPGVVHFHVLHRFQVLDPPARKVVNTPTFLLGTGVATGGMVGFRYASNSRLVRGRPNEWELFGRWAPLREERHGISGAVRLGWNGTAESVDGELALVRELGPVALHVAGRGFSAWAGEEAAAAIGLGAVWRAHRWAALAGDVARVLDSGTDVGWGAGLQLRIPYTPHTLSVHVSNVNATTLQSASVGEPDRRLWGFEFTVPITLARYFGGGAQPGPPVSAPRPADTARVSMDNRLRFLPDTVRIAIGSAVLWSNDSDIVHTVTADPTKAVDPGRVRLPDGATTFDSGVLVPGARFVHVFERAGTYRYICLPHEAAGMAGVVIVGPVSADSRGRAAARGAPHP